MSVSIRDPEELGEKKYIYVKRSVSHGFNISVDIRRIQCNFKQQHFRKDSTHKVDFGEMVLQLLGTRHMQEYIEMAFGVATPTKIVRRCLGL